MQDSTFKIKLNFINFSSEFKRVTVIFVGRAASSTSLHVFTSGSKMYIKGLYTWMWVFCERRETADWSIFTEVANIMLWKATILFFESMLIFFLHWEQMHSPVTKDSRAGQTLRPSTTITSATMADTFIICVKQHLVLRDKQGVNKSNYANSNLKYVLKQPCSSSSSSSSSSLSPYWGSGNNVMKFRLNK